MPRYDGTGPQGGGPMTGRADGYCAVSEAKTGRTTGYVGLFGRPIGGFFGRFFGSGRMRGRGRGR